MRRGRSVQAGDLKAGNITPLLVWMTMSTRLTLPSAAQGLGLTWYIFECLHLLSGTHELKTGLAAGASLLDGIKLNLHVFELNAEVRELIVKISVSMDLTGEPPVVMSKKGVMQDLEVSGGAHHEETEPHWDGKCRFGFPFFIILVISLHVKVDDVGRSAWSISVHIP